MSNDLQIPVRPAFFHPLKTRMGGGILAPLLFAGILSAQAQTEFEVSSWSVDGGGAPSSGLGFELVGSAGQPDAGRSKGGDFEIASGYWRESQLPPTATPIPSSTPPPTPTRAATPTPSSTPPPTPAPTGASTSSPTSTPTSEEPPCDSGYYVLDSFGGRHQVGLPPIITGPVFFAEPIAKDMEPVKCLIDGAAEIDLAMLDGMGAVHFVMNPDSTITQDFYFGDQVTNSPQGRAVDIEVSRDGRGLWVLTDFGGIYRAGSTLAPGQPARVSGPGNQGVLGYDLPISKDVQSASFPQTFNGRLYAVSLIVIDFDNDSLADGYIVLDSMGGQYRYDPEGNSIEAGFSETFPVNDPRRLLDPNAYAWPFFPGLDIARDMELHSSQQGVVILDGWGGIHPVPVDDPSNPIYFANNRISREDTTPLSLTGMPYVTGGFDNPLTAVDESDSATVGPDVASIFKDIEFSNCADGFYLLDCFGGVFTFGGARSAPDSAEPRFRGGPYFFPLPFAVDQEIFPADAAPSRQEEVDSDR